MGERVALVTGASGGIGRAIATELARRGHPVVVNYLARTDGAKKTLEMIQEAGGEGLIVRADVGEGADVDRMFTEAEEALGPVAILVNNAGTRRDSLAMSMKDDAWEAVIRTNLYGTFACCRRGLRRMVRARWGRIVNVSSIVALRGNPGQINYAAAKAGIVGLTKTLAREVASRNITVNAVAPGLVPTDLTTNLEPAQWAELEKEIPLGRAGTPEEIASLVGWLSSEDAGYITGGVFPVDGGLTS